MRRILGALLTTALGCTTGEIEGSDRESTTPSLTPVLPSTPPDAPSPSPAPAPSGKSVEVTYYWVAERPEGDPDHVRINDCDGALLTWASTEFQRAVELERTARAISPSGKKITFNDVGGCFRVLDPKYPWGIGVTSETEGPYALVPFRSIAVDPAVFEIGRWYYVPELVGKTTPSPSVFTHDGCVRAVDVGGGIKGAHIDLFLGNESARASFELETVTLEEAGTRCGG